LRKTLLPEQQFEQAQAITPEHSPALERTFDGARSDIQWFASVVVCPVGRRHYLKRKGNKSVQHNTPPHFDAVFAAPYSSQGAQMQISWMLEVIHGDEFLAGSPPHLSNIVPCA